MEKPIVKVSNLSKSYSLYRKKSDKLLEMFSLKKGEQFLALSDISFKVFKGETIGIIGINGSGKSTLSSILAQIVPPTKGRVEVHGEVSLVAISAGLNNQLTGMENIELKCLMHGLTKNEIDEITPLIVEFADIGDFIHQPIKSYSSGMKSRLGFSISIFINPDILVIDEALSVGDSTFYQKCLNVFSDYQKQGKTIFFISHSLSQVKKISSKILWINFGKVEMFDSTEKVASEYQKFITHFNKMSKVEQKEYRTKMLRSQTEQHERNKAQKDKEVLSQGERYRQEHALSGSKVVVMAQLLFVITLFFSSIFFLFSNEESESEKAQTDIEKMASQIELPSVEEKEENNEVIIINENALTIVPSTPIYIDEELSEEFAKLSFGTEVTLLTEQTSSHTYGLEMNGEQVYIQKDKVKLTNDIKDTTDLEISQISFLFPQEFIDSYQYLLYFLNEDKEQVKESLQGITNEYVDSELGLSVINYAYVKTTYYFDENDEVQTIEVSDVDIDKESNMGEIKSNSVILYEDTNNLGVLIENFILLFDFNNLTVQIQSRTF